VAPIEPELAWPEVKDFLRASVVTEMERGCAEPLPDEDDEVGACGPRSFWTICGNEREATFSGSVLAPCAQGCGGLDASQLGGS